MTIFRAIIKKAIGVFLPKSLFLAIRKDKEELKLQQALPSRLYVVSTPPCMEE